MHIIFLQYLYNFYIIFFQYFSVQEQIRLLKDLKGVAESMVEAEQKLVIQQVCVLENSCLLLKGL